MKDRCELPSGSNFAFYGGRGISVCREWSQSYVAFRAWAVESGYADGLSIDRIDVNGNYEPGNCRWASAAQQSANKRQAKNEIIVDHDGVCLNLHEWSARSGIRYTTLRKRHIKGLRAADLFAPVDQRKSRAG